MNVRFRLLYDNLLNFTVSILNDVNALLQTVLQCTRNAVNFRDLSVFSIDSLDSIRSTYENVESEVWQVVKAIFTFSTLS